MWGCNESPSFTILKISATKIYLFIYFAVLEFELRAYTLSYSTSRFFCDFFFFKIENL
jgi:hypothetical protein